MSKDNTKENIRKEDLFNRLDCYDQQYNTLDKAIDVLENDGVFNDVPCDALYVLQSLRMVVDLIECKRSLVNLELNHIDERWVDDHIEI
jgi:hypothetical protein